MTALPYRRRPLISFTRERIILQLQLATPGSGSMTSRIKRSISSLEEATARTWSFFSSYTVDLRDDFVPLQYLRDLGKRVRQGFNFKIA